MHKDMQLTVGGRAETPSAGACRDGSANRAQSHLDMEGCGFLKQALMRAALGWSHQPDGITGTGTILGETILVHLWVG